MPNLKALIVGIGIVGERHAAAQKKYGSLVGVFDIQSSKASGIAAKNDYQYFETLEDGLAWADVVHICTPDDAHFLASSLAIQAHKNVLCEKPLTTNIQEAVALEKLVMKHKTRFIVANNYRLTPVFQSIKHAVARIEEPVISLETTYLHNMTKLVGKTAWRKNQSFLYGGAIHAIDLAIWIASEPVINVMASQQVLRLKNKEFSMTNLHCVIEFASGLLAHVWANSAIALPIHKTDVKLSTENSTMFADNKSGILHSYSKFSPQKVFSHHRFPTPLTIDLEVHLFNDFILKKKSTHSPLPTIHEAIKILEVTTAITHSIETDKKVFLKKIRV